MSFIAYVDNEEFFDKIVSEQKKGFIKTKEKLFENVRLGNRDEIEEDTTKKQLIAYSKVYVGDEIMTTTRVGGDDRLVGQMSVGVGGHVERIDMQEFGHFMLNDPVTSCAMREMNEELSFKNAYIVGFEREGIVFNLTDNVGKCHVGIVFSFRFNRDARVTVTDDSLRGDLMSPDDIDRDQLEEWSRLCLT